MVMGTPAFPNLGKHCSVDDCRLIDFLPFTCDCCNKVFCLEHRSYTSHQCPNSNKNNHTVVICPLCAKGVHLIPGQDPNSTWQSHINTDCDPSNSTKVTKKKKCPARGCKQTLTFSNTIKCRNCTINHCLKHRFGLDHGCPGPRKPEPVFPFWGLSNSKKQASSSSRWTASLINAASFMLGNGGTVDEKKGVTKVTIDVCPKCGNGFRDPVVLVDHVEREHRGTSKA